MDSEEQTTGAPDPIVVDTRSSELAIVTMRGEFDLHSWTEVTLALATAGARPGVIIDLGGCTFLDSTVLTALLVAAKGLRGRAGTFAVVIPQASVLRRIFAVMNVDALMDIHESLAAALSASAPPEANAGGVPQRALAQMRRAEAPGDGDRALGEVA